MKKRNSLLLTGWGFFIVLFVLIFTISAQGVQQTAGESPPMRADVITIDVLKNFGGLEQPAVVFLHDLHTDALEKQNKDCSACHLTDKDRRSPKYERLKDTNKQEVMNIYHLNCQQCHKEVRQAGEKGGPVEKCGECHRTTPKAVSDRQPMGLDKSLHYRHTRAAKDKCELCHHEYNEKTDKLFYAKGEEGTCRYCHQEETEENRISYKQASHLQCIDCHRKKIVEAEEKGVAGDKVAGPYKCSGCHAEEMQQAIKKLKDVPRMKRNQPDAVLIQAIKIDKDKPKMAATVLMNPVPFDHAAHENYNDTCRICHHADMKKCAGCHTVAGAKEGDFVKSERAMHQTDSQRSCLGCHATRQEQQICAGCHELIAKEEKQDTNLCLHCHMEPPNPKVKMKPEVVARRMLKSRAVVTDTYRDEDLPEVVTIKDLADKYEPVSFPHRQILRRLMGDIKNEKLAQYFHRQRGTVCQACHHNSPAAKKPPRCYSCHGKPFDEKEPLRPGMKGAYHQQCFACHKAMRIKQPNSVNCVECHKEKKK